jgi:hypothetical protein
MRTVVVGFVELLNVSLRKRAWDAHLRFENNGKRYFYSPSRKKIQSASYANAVASVRGLRSSAD